MDNDAHRVPHLGKIGNRVDAALARLEDVEGHGGSVGQQGAAPLTGAEGADWGEGKYVSPYRHRMFNTYLIYRAYRVPYDWAPQAERAEETAIPHVDISKFRVPKSPRKLKERVTTIKEG